MSNLKVSLSCRRLLRFTQAVITCHAGGYYTSRRRLLCVAQAAISLLQRSVFVSHIDVGKQTGLAGQHCKRVAGPSRVGPLIIETKCYLVSFGLLIN